MTQLFGHSTRAWFAGTCLLTVLTFSLVSCGGEENGPVAPNQTSAPQVSSGQFDVASFIIFDTCNETDLYDQTFDITIDSLSFTIGNEWTGTWDPETATGLAESERLATPGRCTVTTWTVVRVTFSTTEEFTGEIIFRRRVDGDCGVPCLTTWRITGTRQQSMP